MDVEVNITVTKRKYLIGQSLECPVCGSRDCWANNALQARLRKLAVIIPITPLPEHKKRIRLTKEELAERANKYNKAHRDRNRNNPEWQARAKARRKASKRRVKIWRQLQTIWLIREAINPTVEK